MGVKGLKSVHGQVILVPIGCKGLTQECIPVASLKRHFNSLLKVQLYQKFKIILINMLSVM